MKTRYIPMPLPLQGFGRRQAWRERFLAIAREVENAPAEAFRPPLSPVRRIPLVRARARS